MSGIRIYMEGGGESKETKAPLRTGMDHFLVELKGQVQAKRWTWKLIPCGGRDESYRAFENARIQHPDEIVLLLVDAERPVSKSPIEHLTSNSWVFAGVDERRVHLMAQTMETWLVSDVAALQRFYGQGFVASALPTTPNLETVAKETLADALSRATIKTGKGLYHKIHHASQLLQRIDPQLARQRCRHCERMFVVVNALIMQ